MVITLSMEQHTRLLTWASDITEDHVHADCLPPGYTLHIEMGVPFPADAFAVSGSRRLELGEVTVSLS